MAPSDASRSLPRGERPRNRILAALPAKDLARLGSSLERIALEPRDILYDPDQPIKYVYFPEDSLASSRWDHGRRQRPEDEQRHAVSG